MKTFRNFPFFLPLYFVTYLSHIQTADSLKISLGTSTITTPTPNETISVENNTSSTASGFLEPTPFHENSSLHNGDNSTTFTPLNKTEAVETFTPPPSVQRLAQVINDTILSINELIITSMRNVSQQGQHDFLKVGQLLQNMQSFLSARGNILSQDVETNLERELRGIQSFIGEHEHKFQNLSHFSSNKNLTNKSHISHIHILEVGTENNDQNATLDGENYSRTAKGGPQSGMVNNIMQFSSKVGDGLRSTIEGAENIVTNSVNQIQNRIQNFLSGISNFFTKTNTQPSSKRLFNLSRNGLQQYPLMFRGQDIISQ